MVLSIAIGLQLTSGALVSPNSLLRILCDCGYYLNGVLGVCSIRNSRKQWRSLLCTTTMVHDSVRLHYAIYFKNPMVNIFIQK